MFYESPLQKASRQPASFYISSRFSLSRPPQTLPLEEPATFKYLGLTLDPAIVRAGSRQPKNTYAQKKINASYETVAAVAHSLRYDSPSTDRSIRSSPYILCKMWQPCVLSVATDNLRYLVNNVQIDAVEQTLIHSLQRRLHWFTSQHITMIEMGIHPLRLQQALHLVALHLRYTVLYPNIIAA